MNLDHHQEFLKIDREGMYEHLLNLPEQLDLAWRLGTQYPLPRMGSINHVIVAGMGGSAIGGDLLAAYLMNKSSVPITVLRGYTLPEWASAEGTLVVASSHSGNTEETLSAYDAAKRKGIKRLAMCTGGKLMSKAESDDVPVWRFEHRGQPRAAVGFSFGILLALMYRLGAVTNPGESINTAVRLMKEQQKELESERYLMDNPAKQLALRISDKFPVVFAADYLIPIARRWKGQFNELAKYWAQFEELPEADHNTLAGTDHPRKVLARMKMILLSAESDHPRNRLRIMLTRDAMQGKGIDAEVVEARGKDTLACIWTALQLGDFVAYYLAMIKNVDPTPIKIMSDLKKAMSEHPYP